VDSERLERMVRDKIMEPGEMVEIHKAYYDYMVAEHQIGSVFFLIAGLTIITIVFICTKYG